MARNLIPFPEKGGETEKITINLGYVDLGRVDLLVQEGFYSNRTDFIRTAIRNQLTTHNEAVNQSLLRKTLEIGLRDYSRARPRSGQSRQPEAPDKDPRPRADRRRCLARARPGDDRIHHRAGRASSEPGGQSRTRRTHPIKKNP